MDGSNEKWRQGCVNWYRGSFGFILQDDGESVFVHLGALQKNKINPLDVSGGLRVEYIATKKPNRANPEVVHIKMIV